MSRGSTGWTRSKTVLPRSRGSECKPIIPARTTICAAAPINSSGRSRCLHQSTIPPTRGQFAGRSNEISDMNHLLAMGPEAGHGEESRSAQKEHQRGAQHAADSGEEIDVTTNGPQQKEEHAGGEQLAPIAVEPRANQPDRQGDQRQIADNRGNNNRGGPTAEMVGVVAVSR